MGELVQDGIIVVVTTYKVIDLSGLILENIVTYSRSWLQGGTNDEVLVVSIGKLEFDYLRAGLVEMGILFRIICDLFERWLELSDVDSSRSDISVDILSKSLEVIEWVLALSEILPELVI